MGTPNVDLLSDLINNRATLALYYGTGLAESSAMSMSDINDHFDCKVVKDWRAEREGWQKMASALFGRLDGIAKGIGVVVKSIGELGKVLGSRGGL